MTITENLISQMRDDGHNIICKFFIPKGILLLQIITSEDIIQAFHNSHLILSSDLSVPSTANWLMNVY